jgi:hypothetical protein
MCIHLLITLFLYISQYLQLYFAFLIIETLIYLWVVYLYYLFLHSFKFTIIFVSNLHSIINPVLNNRILIINWFNQLFQLRELLFIVQTLLIDIMFNLTDSIDYLLFIVDKFFFWFFYLRLEGHLGVSEGV